jgi:hypothetical protein
MIENIPPLILFTGAATAVLMTVIISFAIVQSQRESRSELLLKRLAALERMNELLTGPVLRMNAAIQQMLVLKLTHYHTPETDRLLAKLSPFTLTPEEEVELIAALHERELDMGNLIDDEERSAAKLLPIIMRLVAAENAKPMETFELKLVAVPKAVEGIGV